MKDHGIVTILFSALWGELLKKNNTRTHTDTRKNIGFFLSLINY